MTMNKIKPAQVALITYAFALDYHVSWFKGTATWKPSTSRDGETLFELIHYIKAEIPSSPFFEED